MKSLKKTLFGDKVPLPLHVNEKAEKYRKKGESMIHFFSKVCYKGEYYFCISYPPSNEEVFIREDGTVPNLSDVMGPPYKDPLWIAKATDSMVVLNQKAGKKWLKGKYVNAQFQSLQSLDKINRNLRGMMPDEIQNALDEFYKVPRTYLEKTKTLEESYQKGKKIVDQLFETKTVNSEITDELERYHNTLMRSVYFRNYVQVETTVDREKLLEYLASKISIFQFDLWKAYYQLKKLHKKMLHKEKLSDDWVELIQDHHEESVNENEFIGRKEFYKEMIPLIRNPK